MQGADTLDAVIEGVKIQELDPADDSVGSGGLPNAEGVVQLDASCLHGPTRRAGAVGALEGIKTPSEVAKLVLEYTNHIMLVGAGAKKFALEYGFHEENLLTEHSREAWLHWRANLNPADDYLDVPVGHPMSVRPTGTINCNAVTPQGDLSSVTSTSGLAFKIPGRVGDSAIVGAGQYADNDVGAAGAGRGARPRPRSAAFLARELLSLCVLQHDRRAVGSAALRPLQPHRLCRAAGAEPRRGERRRRGKHPGQPRAGPRRTGARLVGRLARGAHPHRGARQPPRLLRRRQRQPVRARQRGPGRAVLLRSEPDEARGPRHPPAPRRGAAAPPPGRPRHPQPPPRPAG